MPDIPVAGCGEIRLRADRQLSLPLSGNPDRLSFEPVPVFLIDFLKLRGKSAKLVARR